jgi:hypothetical protein
MSCNHITKVLEWGFDENHDFKAALYGCVMCDVESTTPFKDEEVVEIDHSNCESDPCFGCKAQGLQLSTGDAAHNKNMSKKKWDRELNMYSDARRQGIQPAGTTEKAVRTALEASDKAGKAYDANTNSYV